MELKHYVTCRMAGDLYVEAWRTVREQLLLHKKTEREKAEGDREEKSWKSDVKWWVKEHGVHSDNSHKSDLLWPHTVSCSLCVSHPNSSHAPLKTWNLCWQLNVLTFVTRLPLPPGVGHHWKEEVTRPRRGKVDSDDAFQMRGNKMDGGGCSGSGMFLLVEESQIVFFTMYDKFVSICCHGSVSPWGWGRWPRWGQRSKERSKRRRGKKCTSRCQGCAALLHYYSRCLLSRTCPDLENLLTWTGGLEYWSHLPQSQLRPFICDF